MGNGSIQGSRQVGFGVLWLGGAQNLPERVPGGSLHERLFLHRTDFPGLCAMVTTGEAPVGEV